MTDDLTHVSVQVGHEYGDFFLREGVSGEGDRKTHWCQLTCNTAFGVVGTYWASMGMPALQFFGKVNKDYVLGRLWGLKTDVYCEKTTRDRLKAYLLRERREDSIDRESARAMWNGVDDADLDSEHAFVQFVYTDPYWEDVYSSGGGPESNIRNPQAEGFWEVLWPEYLRLLKEKANA